MGSGYTIWDVDYDGSTFDVDAAGQSPSHTYPDNGTFTVALRASDGTETSAVATATATIANAAPSVGDITGAPLYPVPIGTEVSISVSFTTNRLRALLRTQIALDSLVTAAKIE